MAERANGRVGGRDIIVVGTSAGGVEALIALAAGLPSGLAAAVFVVLHLPPQSHSVLPRILQRTSRLAVQRAEDGEEIFPGRIYVAPPNRHLMLAPGRVRVEAGPHENGHRPAVDPLFRTAARSYGPRVIGVILTGSGDDGTAGLREVKRRGGLAVVQSPSDAFSPGMPRSALEFVRVDHSVPLAEIGPLLGELVALPLPGPEELAPSSGAGAGHAPSGEHPASPVERELAFPERQSLPGPESGFTCPHCNGHLWEIHDGDQLRFRCRVGHALTAESLLQLKDGALEATLWAALNGLEEKAALVRKMSDRASQRGHNLTAERLAARAEESASHARRLRELLTETVAEEDGEEDGEDGVSGDEFASSLAGAGSGAGRSGGTDPACNDREE